MRELELKFSVHEPFALPDLAADGSPVAAVSRVSRSSLRATYFDTPDLRLARAGITLRRRTGGSDAGWHLKLPVAGARAHARDEITAPLGGRGVPAELTELVTAYVRSARLQPVATLRTERASVLLYDPEGAAAAELVDDTVSVLDGTRVVERFREIEVESKGAKLGYLKKVGERLEAAGAVSGAFMPKAVRALGSRAAAPPDVEPPAAVTPKSTAGAVVTAFLRTQLAALLAQDPQVRLDSDDSVHQMRVAARQLRSGLKTFAPLLEAEPAAALREELGWLALALSGARDTEVLSARLLADLDAAGDASLRDTAAPALHRSLQAAQRRGAAALRAALESERYTALLDTLVAIAAAPPLTAAADAVAADALPPLARRSWQRLAKAIDGIDADAPDEQLHRARILAKRARYASEACALAFGRPAARMAKQIVRLQDVLGEHQDAVMAAAALQRMARSSAARTDGRLAFALGMLYCRQGQAAQNARAELPGAWREVSRRPHRAWLE